MRMKLLAIYIKLLEKYLNIGFSISFPEQDKNVENFLADIWMNPNLRKYIVERDTKIILEMAGGSSIAKEPRDNYVKYMGQRGEILYLGRRAKLAYLQKEKEKAELLKKKAV